MTSQPPAAVRLHQIRKTFGPVVANDNIDFELWPGEIHGLLGENGAGKTTLMKILYGIYRPDAGEIYLKGQPCQIESPRQAIRLGIGMVHQHFMQVPRLTVVDNVILGLQDSRRPLLDREAARRRIRDISRLYGLQVDLEARVWQLSVGIRQRVEILKALYREVEVLILDEPTSVLTPQETDELFSTIRSLAAKGLSVIFITHKLEEALSITGRLTVLRDGRAAATLETAGATKADLARLMVGREVLFALERGQGRQVAGTEALRVEKLVVKNDKGVQAVKGVSFSVRRGEIVGLAGVDGNGQSELVQALTGLRPTESGRIWIERAEVTHASPRTILQQGVAHIPEDLADALVDDFSLAENLALDRHYTPELSRGGILNLRKMSQLAREVIKQYDVRAPHERVRAGTLSGGNKQKLVIGRELSRQSRLIIAAHPTRGVDIGATEHIRRLLLERRQAGDAILLVSSSLDEILSLSDRILVMEGGRFTGEVQREEATIERIGLLMAGAGEV